jgi:hypothetical protein
MSFEKARKGQICAEHALQTWHKPARDPCDQPGVLLAHLARCAARPVPKPKWARPYNVAGSISLSIDGSGSPWILASKPRKRL